MPFVITSPSKSRNDYDRLFLVNILGPYVPYLDYFDCSSKNVLRARFEDLKKLSLIYLHDSNWYSTVLYLD